MGSHVTFRKIRKTVHNVMLKYGNKKFYRKIDWIEKVLKKLRVRPTLKRKARIRNQINKWLNENSEILDTKTDSKKGILDSKFTSNLTDNKDHPAEKKTTDLSTDNKDHASEKRTAGPINNKDHSTQKKSEGNSNNIRENQQQAKVQEQVGISKPNSSNVSIPPMPEAIPIIKLKEEISVIDLISDDEKEIVKSKVEVITIDDDIEIIDKKIFPQQPLIRLPEQYYSIPNFSFYDYYQNEYFFYPVIVEPHSVNF